MGFWVWNGADLPGPGLQAEPYCSARGIADGWRNADGPVRNEGLRLQLPMEKYFWADDTKVCGDQLSNA